ncbi:hypothetical protein BX600DRAFT_31253 [Xylariales sp. PMI_506]|nr:hypothetical protein BX600DRAFT_31253 [Xylariales sp. PMI_506]
MGECDSYWMREQKRLFMFGFSSTSGEIPWGVWCCHIGCRQWTQWTWIMNNMYNAEKEAINRWRGTKRQPSWVLFFYYLCFSFLWMDMLPYPERRQQLVMSHLVFMHMFFISACDLAYGITASLRIDILPRASPCWS